MNKRLLFLLCIYTLVFSVGSSLSDLQAQTLYWVGDGGSWNDPSHWSSSSGGTGNAGVPDGSTSVVFDANSFATTGQTVALTSGATCATVNWTGVGNSPTLDLAAALTVTGNSATFADAMNLTGTAAISFTSTGNVTVNLGNTARTFGNLSFAQNSSRTLTINSSTNAAVTQRLGVLTVGNSATVNLTGASAKVIGGLSFGTGTTSTFAGSYVYTGSVTFAANASINAALPGGWSNNTFNGPVSVGFSGVPITLSASTFNANASILANGNMSSCTLSAGVTLTVNYFFINGGNSFAAGATVTNGTLLRVTTATGNTFNNNWTVGGTVGFDGNNVFNGNVTLNAGAGWTVTGNPTFNGSVSVGNSASVTAGNNPTFNGPVSTGVNISGNFNGSPSFAANVTVGGTGGGGLNFNGRAVFAPGTTLTLGSTANAAVTFSGAVNHTFHNVVLGAAGGSASQVTFSNTGTNTFNNVTVNPGATWRFGTGGTSTVAGDFLANTAVCGVSPASVNSNTGSTQATVNFNTFSNRTNVNVSNINNTGAPVTILSGVGTNNTNISIPAVASARTLYWIGGSGNWSDLNRWSTISGGPANTCPPTLIDNVVFDANSFPATGQTVTVGLGSVCNNMTWATATNNPTLNLSQDLAIKGTSVTFANAMIISGSGRVVLDNAADITVDLGTSAKSINGGLTFTATTTRTITLNTTSSAVTHSFGQLTVGSNATVNVTGSSTKNYGPVSLGTVGGTWAGNNNFGNATVAGTLAGGLTISNAAFAGVANLTGQYTFSGTTSINTGASVSFLGTGGVGFANLAVSNATTGSTTRLLLQPASTNSVSGTLTVNASCGPVLLGSATSGSQARLSMASNQTINGPTVQDIQRIGAGSLTVNNGLNNGNNSGVTFNFGATASRILYWVGGTGNWSDPNRWSLVSGGAGGQCPPTINDDVNFTAASFSAPGQIVTIDADAFCRSMNWTGATNTPALAGNSARTLTIAGNLTLIAAMTQTGASPTYQGKVTFASSTTGRTINPNGQTFANVDFNGQGGGWSLSSTFSVINTTNLIAGALSSNNRILNSGILSVNHASDLVRSLNLGNQTHTLSGTGTVLDLRGNTSNFTLTAGTSTISFSNAGVVTIETGSQSKTLPVLTFANSNAITINTSNSANRIAFGAINVNGSVTRTFAVNGTAPKTYGNIIINGSNNTVTFDGSHASSPDNNIFGNVTFANAFSGTAATFNGNNLFNGAVAIHSTSGSGSDIRFTGTNAFASTFTANLSSPSGTELQFGTSGGTTSFAGAVSLNPLNSASVDILFNNATSFAAGLTIGSNSSTVFEGTGDNTFAAVTVNPSSNFTLDHDGNATFASALVNSQSGTGVSWVFRSSKAATFAGTMDIRAICSAPVTVSASTAGVRAMVSMPAVQYFNNQVIVRDIDASAGALINAYAFAIPASPNNVNVTYNDGITTHRTLYWVGGTGNWGDPLRWSTRSGGAGGACIPTPVDDVFFDNASFTAGGQTATINIATATCRNISWVNGAIPATTTFAMGNNPLEINGSLSLAPNLNITGSATLAVVNFTTNAAAANAQAARSITTPAGTTASLPAVLFYDPAPVPNVTWTLLGPATFSVSGELGLQGGTLNTNTIAVRCQALNMNKYTNGNPVLPAFANRVLDLQNSTVTLTGANRLVIDFRGDLFTFPAPGPNAAFVLGNASAYQQVRLGDNNTNLPYYGVNPGSPRTTALLREMPDFVLQSRDVDIVTADYNVTDGVANRILFRGITNVNGGQFYINGTCPHTYGAITVANNLTSGGVDQRQIVGSNQAPPNHNIFNGPVSFGTNTSFRFLGYNEFNDTFTVDRTSDANNSFLFNVTNLFNKPVDITGLNTLRNQATVHFNNAGGTTAFRDNVIFRGAGVIHRLSGATTLAAGKTMTFDTESVGWFAGGAGVSSTGYPSPGSASYTFNGDLMVSDYAKVSFYNTTVNTVGNVTLSDYSTFQFSSVGTTNVTGTLTASASCSSWIQINGTNPGVQAKMSFASPQSWTSILARDLNNISASATVTATNSTNVGNCTNINFVTGISPGTFVWVGGHPGNTSENSLWSNPKNWATAPVTPAKIVNGGSCIPSSINDVVFDNNSFSNGTPLTDSLGNVKYYDRVIVDVSTATCASMSWQPSIQQDAILMSDNALNELWIQGSLTFDPKMKNQFTGLISFRAPAIVGEQFVDMNGSGGGAGLVNFVGPIEINTVGTRYRLESPLVIDAADNGTARRGNLSVVYGDFRSNGYDISLTGNWTIGRPAGSNPQGRFIHNNNTVTFNGQDAVNGTQNIVAGTSPFYNLVINRGGRPAPTDVSYNAGNVYATNLNQGVITNPRRWVVVRNSRDLGAGSAPGTTANNNQPFNSGMTVDNNLTITQGGLYDYGFQIIGNANGNLTLTDNAVLSIGNGMVSSGINNNAPLTTVFPTNYTQARISLSTGSVVSYSAAGHQDVSSAPIYGNLYFRYVLNDQNGNNLPQAITQQRKRLALGPLQINGNLTLEQGINLIDNGFQISGNSAATSVLTLNAGSVLTLGSGAMDVATTTGSGYAPASNTTGRLTVGNSATQFPLNFTDANLNLDAASTIVYNAGVAQSVRGLNSATAAQQYGNLTVQNPTLTSPSLLPRTLTATTRIRGVLTIHPNSNLVDNGFQINGTAGRVFTMNYKTDPMGAVFNNQTPNASGVMSNPTSPLFIDSLLTRPNYVALRFDGFISIPVAGSYTFFTSSDDQSVLMINNIVVVNNDYYQGATERSGTMSFAAAGVYPLSLTYTQGNGSRYLALSWQRTTAPTLAKQFIPAASLLRSAGGPQGLNYSYYENPGNTNYASAYGASYKMVQDLTAQLPVQNRYVVGEARLVTGNATVATLFPANYTDADLTFDEGTTVIYNAGVSQAVRGLNSTTPAQQYANLVLTNPVAAAPRVVSKTLAGPATVRQGLTINPNNNLIDNGNQLSGTAGQAFTMRNATPAPDPLTNVGTAGAAGESRITIGNATTATLFPLNYSLTATDVNFELGTTVVYNAGIVQPIAALQSATATSRYANLMLTNPATVPASGSVFPIVKTLQNSITVRGTITVNPNNTLADGGFQLSGTSGSAFNMYNATLTQTVVPETGATTGSAGESRFVINSVNSGTVRTFPTGLRTGAAGGSDINFETGTTVVYNANANQSIQGLGGMGNTTYANLVLSNPVASSATLIDKTLTSNGTLSSGTTVRGTLTVNPNVNLVDGGFQLGGVGGQTFRMRNTTLADNLLRVSTGDATTVGTTGPSRLTLGTATVATSFPTGYVTLESTDINFELGTTVVYNAGVAQAVRGIFHSSVASNANYANVSFVNPAASGTVTKTIGTSMRVRQNLTIGGVTAATASGAANQLDASIANCKINLGGNWFTHPGNGFHARAGEVELEGSSNQTITTQNIQSFSSELTTQDFYNLRINNTTALPAVAVTLASNVGVAGTMIFQRGLVQSASLSGAGLTVSPTSGLLIIRHNGTASSASDNSFVLGAVRKVGQVASGTFFFPVGYLSGSTPYYRPSGISAMSDNSGAFVSQFYFQHPSSAGFNTTLLQTTAVGVSQPLRNVSVREFWMVNRENSAGGTAFVSLTWRNPESGGVGTNGVATNYLGLRVARWNGSLWQNLGGDVTKFAAYNGSLNNTNGSLTSQYNTAGAATNPVNSFSPFTLASEIDFNPLPVTLLDFAAQPAGGQVKLSWQTASERNTAHFVVQRSADGKSFERVGQVPAKGNSAELALYQSLDTDPYTGLSYYRLQMVDLDGSVSYSKVVRVNLGVGGGLGETVLFPNPTDGRTVNIRVGAGAKVVAIHDMLGRRVAYRSGWNGDGSLAVDFVQVLAKGTYVAVVLSADGSQTARIKFVVP